MSHRNAPRNRDPARIISPQEAEERAAKLEVEAKSMPFCEAQSALLKQAHNLRALAEMKRFLTT